MAGAREHRWVIDAIEESIASIELDDGSMMRIPRAQLPESAKEGSVLRVSIEVDPAATKTAREESAAQVERIRKRQKDPGGDIKL